MDAKNVKAQLIEYNELFHRHANFNAAYSKISFSLEIIHLLMWLIALANFSALSGWEILSGFSKIPVLKDIPSLMPFYSGNGFLFLICAVLTVFLIPKWLQKPLSSAAWNNMDLSKAPLIDEDCVKAFNDIKKRYDPVDKSSSPFILGACIGIVFGIIAGTFVGWMLVVISTLVVEVAFMFYSYDNPYAHKYWEFKQLEKDAKEYEQQRIEKEKKRKEAEAAEQARIKKEQQALAAENEFAQLENPEDDEDKVTHLADLGSPSACLLVGRKLYQKFRAERLTNSEKTALVKKALTYLTVSGNIGNIEAKFLSLYLRTNIERNNGTIWESYLSEARAIKSSGELPDSYSRQMDELIKDLIGVINKCDEPAPFSQPRRMYCRFFAAGQCGHHMCRCFHPDDPGSCATALNHKGLVFE